MKKIAVIGSINMDMTARAQRIPRPGETVSAESLAYVPGGKGANQAVAAARLGGDVAMFGLVGDDGFGPQLLENLRANGVNADGVGVSPGVSSGLAMIVVAEGDNAITVIPGANALVTPAYLQSVWPEIEKADIALLQNEIPAETVLWAAQRLHRAGKTVIYTPAPARPAEPALLDAVTYFTPNEHEARLVLGDETTALETLIARQGGKMIVNTQKMNPMPVITGAAQYPEGVLDELKSKGVFVDEIDALSLAQQAGKAKSVNIVLMGRLAKYFDIAYDKWVEAIKVSVKPQFVDVNLKAFDLGYNF